MKTQKFDYAAAEKLLAESARVMKLPPKGKRKQGNNITLKRPAMTAIYNSAPAPTNTAEILEWEWTHDPKARVAFTDKTNFVTWRKAELEGRILDHGGHGWTFLPPACEP